MKHLQDTLFSGINLVHRTGGHYRIPKNSDWRADNDIFDQTLFYFIISGKCSVTIDGKEFIGEAGDWFLIPSSTVYSYYNFKDEPFEKYWVHFDLFPGIFDRLKLSPHVRADAPEKIASLFQSYAKISNSEQMCDIIEVKSILLKLFSEYLRLCSAERSFDGIDTKNGIYKVLSFINENLEKPISNAELAEFLHMHPNHFIRYFKREMGQTPQRYITHRRVEQAKRLLIETNLPTSAIAEMTGLSDSAHLSKLFKSIYALSPSQYRKNNSKNSINS